MIHFFKKLLVVDFVLLVILMVLQYIIVLPAFIEFIWLCLIFFNLVSVIIFSLSARGALHKSPHRFMTFITGSFILKFVLCITGIVAYVLIMKPKSILIVIPFFIFYAVFTALEVSELLYLLKGLKKKQG